MLINYDRVQTKYTKYHYTQPTPYSNNEPALIMYDELIARYLLEKRYQLGKFSTQRDCCRNPFLY